MITILLGYERFSWCITYILVAWKVMEISELIPPNINRTTYIGIKFKIIFEVLLIIWETVHWGPGPANWLLASNQLIPIHERLFIPLFSVWFLLHRGLNQRRIPYYVQSIWTDSFNWLSFMRLMRGCELFINIGINNIGDRHVIAKPHEYKIEKFYPGADL